MKLKVYILLFKICLKIKYALAISIYNQSNFDSHATKMMYVAENLTMNNFKITTLFQTSTVACLHFFSN